MYGIKSNHGRWSVSLCNCSQDTAHFHYGNVVLHISRDDLRELGLAMQSVADGAEQMHAGHRDAAKKGLVLVGSVIMPQIVSIIIKGGIVMIPLLACSLISLALTIERILFWTKLKSKHALQEMLALVEN